MRHKIASQSVFSILLQKTLLLSTRFIEIKLRGTDKWNLVHQTKLAWLSAIYCNLQRHALTTCTPHSHGGDFVVRGNKLVLKWTFKNWPQLRGMVKNMPLLRGVHHKLIKRSWYSGASIMPFLLYLNIQSNQFYRIRSFPQRVQEYEVMLPIIS